jgi:2-keto-4-pentenoate hydratase/2-oxohepta-3-ene-1,7-dioic acid hydratase in catechol pathway
MRCRTTTSRTSIGSARDWQKRRELSGGQGCRGKSFDTFAALGPVLVPAAELPDPNALTIEGIGTLRNPVVAEGGGG